MLCLFCLCNSNLNWMLELLCNLGSEVAFSTNPLCIHSKLCAAHVLSWPTTFSNKYTSSHPEEMSLTVRAAVNPLMCQGNPSKSKVLWKKNWFLSGWQVDKSQRPLRPKGPPRLAPPLGPLSSEIAEQNKIKRCSVIQLRCSCDVPKIKKKKKKNTLSPAKQ